MTSEVFDPIPELAEPDLGYVAHLDPLAVETGAQLLAKGHARLEALDRVLSRLTPDHFVVGLQARVWRVLAEARQSGKSGQMLTPEVQEQLGGDMALLQELNALSQANQESSATPEEVERLAGVLLRCAQKRQEKAALQRLRELADDPRPPAELLREVVDLVDQFRHGHDDHHPLFDFVEIDDKPEAVRWVIPGLIEEGVMTIAGARGVGKTSAVIPLAMVAASLHGPRNALAPHPERWRHVIYITEMVSQAKRILRGVVSHAGLGITWGQAKERFHLVPARRLDPALVASVGSIYRRQFTRQVDGVEIPPLVVFDTLPSVFNMENENDNAEASRIMALLKQEFGEMPAWLVCHIAKTDIQRTDGKLTARGAGAFEADAAGCFYIAADGEARYFFVGKHRAEPAHGTELQIVPGEAIETAYDQWGDPQQTHLRWGLIEPMTHSRAEIAAEAQEAAQAEHLGEIRGQLFETARDAWERGNPLSRSALVDLVKGKTDIKRNQLAALLHEGRLIERDIPASQRVNSRKASYLLPLEPDETHAWATTGKLPHRKAAHPKTWAKQDPPGKQNG